MYMGSSRQALHPGLFKMFSLRTESICVTNGGWWKVCTMSKDRIWIWKSLNEVPKTANYVKKLKAKHRWRDETQTGFLTKYIGPVAIANNAKEKRFHTDRKKRNIVAGMTCLCILHKLTLILQPVTIHTNHSAEMVWFFFLFIESLVFLKVMYLTTCPSLGNPLFCKLIQLFKHWKKKVTSQSLTFPYRLS